MKNNFFKNFDYSDKFNNEEIEYFKKFALMSYIPFVSFYFIFGGKTNNSEYFKFHSIQGFNLTLFLCICVFICKIISIFDIGYFISCNIWFICFLYFLYGIINTYNNKSMTLPFIGNIKLIK